MKLLILFPTFQQAEQVLVRKKPNFWPYSDIQKALSSPLGGVHLVASAGKSEGL